MLASVPRAGAWGFLPLETPPRDWSLQPFSGQGCRCRDVSLCVPWQRSGLVLGTRSGPALEARHTGGK